MVETGLLEQEPEPDIRSLPLRTSTTTTNALEPRVNPSPPSSRQIKEKDFVVVTAAAAAAAEDTHIVPVVVATDQQQQATGPAFTRLRRPYIDGYGPDVPQRSQSTPPTSSRVPFAPQDARSEFAKAEPLPPARLNDIGPPRPPKRIAELFAPDRKLGGDPGWAQSCVNTIKCMSLLFE